MGTEVKEAMGREVKGREVTGCLGRGGQGKWKVVDGGKEVKRREVK